MMGNSTSKQYTSSNEKRKSISSEQSTMFDEKKASAYKLKADNLTSELRGLKLDQKDGEFNSITIDKLQTWEKEIYEDSKNRLAQNVLSKNAPDTAFRESSYATGLKNRFFFNTEVAVIGSPEFKNNQKSSGRCWIFATSNVLRSKVIKTYNLPQDKFQLSQTYLFFYDKLEKANFFLENILDTSDEPLDSRLISFLTSNPVNDGGQWDMIVNVLTKYGAVPNEVFPDNEQAMSTSKLNYFLTEKLREYALILRKLKNDNYGAEEINKVKAAQMKEVYKIISLSLGSPPKPDESFSWEFKNKDGKYFHFETTPKEFYEKHINFDTTTNFSLINDPRNPYDLLYTVERLNNVHGGRPISYVNTDVDAMKAVAIRMLKDNEPIFFGSDVGKFLDRSTGVLDTNAFNYELGYGTGLNLSKLERLQLGSSSMTHAMVITGVHIDPKTNAPVRWKIENSWGDAVGQKGYFLMTDDWFSEYVYQIVTSKKYLDKKHYDIWKSGKYNVLPYYDPMGALA